MSAPDRPAGRPKYARAEVERRWLAAGERIASLALGSARIIHDRYLDHSRLRLRRVEAAGGEAVFKLCRKYGDRVGAESITNLYLSAAEHALLEALPGWCVTKHRYRLDGGSLDRYDAGDGALWIFEQEFADPESARRFEAPAYTTQEITAAGDYTGAALARRFGTSVGPDRRHP